MKNTLIVENVGGESCEYRAPGKHIFSAPGVCGGRTAFKYTRIEVEVVLDLLAAGEPMQKLDENLLSLQADRAIQKWRRDRVCYITEANSQ